jgi:hypothetical protein
MLHPSAQYNLLPNAISSSLLFCHQSAGANGQAATNGNRRSGRGRGKAGNKGPQKSAAELDAEVGRWLKA